MQEIWKPIPGFLGYDVSNQGRLRSYHARGQYSRIAKLPQRILKQSYDNVGYLKINLCTASQTFRRRVAPLVMLAFVGPRPDGMLVCHNDSDKANNCLENLRYDTHKGNAADMPDKARHAGGQHKLTDEQVIEIRLRYANSPTVTQASLANEYGVRRNTISYV